jgi:hypothetical protein
MQGNKFVSYRIVTNKFVTKKIVVIFATESKHKRRMNNPFLFGAAASGQWFTDREDDARRLRENFIHGINTLVISPRRWGKTSLVRKVSQELDCQAIRIVNIDVFSCRTPEDFYRLFATEVIRQTAGKWEEWVENARQFLSNLSPRISFGADPMSGFSLSLDLTNKTFTEDVLHLPQRISMQKGIKMVVCLDEFQQIAEFSGSITFQKMLRSVWQLQSQHVTYCLYGSKKHIMTALFSNQSMPFYKFGDLIMLPKITADHWIRFIVERFEHSGKHIPDSLAADICKKVENHSSYVQQFSWLIWVRTDETATEQDFENAFRDLINQNSALFYSFVEPLSAYQLNFLKALADGVHDGFSHKEVIDKYSLGTSANVARIRTALENKELIDVFPHLITFNDPVFKWWFKEQFPLF